MAQKIEINLRKMGYRRFVNYRLSLLLSTRAAPTKDEALRRRPGIVHRKRTLPPHDGRAAAQEEAVVRKPKQQHRFIVLIDRPKKAQECRRVASASAVN